MPFLEKIQGYKKLSKQERVLVVERHFERKSYLAVQVAFRQRFSHEPYCKEKIQQNAKKYRSHGTIWIEIKKIHEDEGPLVLKRALNESKIYSEITLETLL